MKHITREQKVAEFHKAGKQGYEKMPLSKMLASRWTLLEEEFWEVAEAIDEAESVSGYKEGLLKELCDLQYVLSGTVDALGWTPVFDVAFNRVHENNMTKFDEGIKYDENGKIRKPASYKNVDLSDLV